MSVYNEERVCGRVFDAVNIYTLYFFITSQALRVRIEGRVRTNVWYRLRRAGIDIPFPTRNVTVYQAPERNEQATREIQASEALAAIALSERPAGQQRSAPEGVPPVP